MKVIKKIDDLKIINENRPIALIPTMGNLHDGHISLVKQSKNLKLTSLVTIFINPLQFGPNEDFETYPRTISKDKENLEKENCDFLFFTREKGITGRNKKIESTIIKLSLWEK